MIVGTKIQCLVHSDRNRFRYGIIISVAKETIMIKYEETEFESEEILEYPKTYLGKELEIIKTENNI